MEQHPGAGEAHNGADAVPHIRAVAWGGTGGAEGLLLHPGTVQAAVPGVGGQGLAVWAETGGNAMVLAAVEGDHFGDQLLFLLPLLIRG